MDISLLIDQLNDGQRNAVCANSPHQLVLAGAGSGKTRVLVHRIAWLLKVENVSPFSVMAVPSPIKPLVRCVPGSSRYSMSHRMACGLGPFMVWRSLLKQHWREAKLPQYFQILDSDDQVRLIKRLMKEHNIDDSRYPPKQIQWYINGQKDEGRRAAHVIPSADPFTPVA